jgi:hypothetical protein
VLLLQQGTMLQQQQIRRCLTSSARIESRPSAASDHTDTSLLPFRQRYARPADLALLPGVSHAWAAREGFGSNILWRSSKHLNVARAGWLCFVFGRLCCFRKE